MATGMFFSFDGIDGTGKSTQARLFVDWIRELGREAVPVRDPGSTPLGEQLRGILLDPCHGELDARAETLLYMAARAQMVAEHIRPALDRGAVVVADRYLLANVAYQGYGLGLSPEALWMVGQFATNDCRPDCTIVLDLPVRLAAARCRESPDRLESRDAAYFARVRTGFLEEAEKHPNRILVVDASRDIDAVQSEIRTRTGAWLQVET